MWTFLCNDTNESLNLCVEKNKAEKTRFTEMNHWREIVKQRLNTNNERNNVFSDKL